MCPLFRNPKLLGIISGLFFGLAFAFTLSAEPEYPSPLGNLSDFANVLDSSTSEQISAIAKNLESKTSTELAVVTVKSVKPETLKGYAVELFRRWGIGKKGKDNGVLFILATQDRRIEIEVGYGLEGILTDAKCGEILDGYAIPYLKKNDWAQALLKGSEAIANTIIQTESQSRQISTVDSSKLHESLRFNFIPMVLFWTILVLFLFIFVIRLRNKPKCPKCGRNKFVQKESSHVVRAATFIQSGIREVTYQCTSCPFTWIRREKIPMKTPYLVSSGGSGWSSGGGSSGFGGFGGGCSGGGGAGRGF